MNTAGLVRFLGTLMLVAAAQVAVAADAAPAAKDKAAKSTKAVVHTIAIDGTAFVPPAMTVARGDTVVWVNRDPFPHTVTATGGAFDSKSIAPGKSWRHVAGAAGDFPYVCTFHPTMKGILQVK